MSTLAERLNAHDPHHQVWDPEIIGVQMPFEVCDVTSRFNNPNYHPLHEVAMQSLQPYLRTKFDELTQIEYLKLAEAGDSRQDAILHFNDIGVNISDDAIIRGEYYRQIFRELGITDDEGRHLPVYLLGAPAGASGLALPAESEAASKMVWEEVARGDLEPVVDAYIDTVLGDNRRLGRISCIGFGLGASIAMATGAASTHRSIETTHVVAGDAFNAAEHKLSSLLFELFYEVTDPQRKKDALFAGIELLKYIPDTHKLRGILRNIWSQRMPNLQLLRAMTANEYYEDTTTALDNGALVTIGTADKCLVTPETAIGNLEADIAFRSSYENLHSIHFKGAHHSIGERANFMATFYGYGLSRKTKIK